MTQLSDLIARLEKASGADRELDGRIAYAIDEAAFQDVQSALVGGDAHSWKCFAGVFNVPAYTASIDAALTLVPEGWPIERLSWWPKTPRGYEDQRVCRVTILEADGEGWGKRRRFDATGINPPIAVCIAALRARASLSATGSIGDTDSPSDTVSKSSLTQSGEGK